MDRKAQEPSPQDFADFNFVKCYMGCCKNRGFSFGLRPKPSAREQVPGPIYQVGCSTLGIAAAQPIKKSEMIQVAVL